MSSGLPISSISEPLTVSGKYFRAGQESIFVKAVTFGPFPAGAFPDEGMSELSRVREELGANAIRIYEIPSVEFLHCCAEIGLRVFITIPWSQHVDIFSDRESLVEGERTLIETVRKFRGHPAVAGYFVGNEIDTTLVRWMGPEKIREEMERWIALGKANDPNSLFAYANYPSTEYLLPRNQDFIAFNLYLEDPESLGNYLNRLQNLAGDKPLLISEFGCDEKAHGEKGQSEMLSWHIDEVCKAGAAGTTIFSWSDRWQRGGKTVEDWDFGLTDREGNAKPALKAVSEKWAGISRPVQGVEISDHPRISVIVCTYLGSETLVGCLKSICELDYPAFEVLVVNDGDDDRIREIVESFEKVKHIGIPHAGLSYARNVGAEAADGDIFAYTDDDCIVSRDWLSWLSRIFLESEETGCAGGPNIVPELLTRKQAKIAAAPGGPAHVLLTDTEAEHVPGCNLAVRRKVFEEIGGFNPTFRTAGDDVDFCWRISEAGYTIGFHAAAFVWHYRRFSYQAYARQQRGYGRAEALLMPLHEEKFRHLGGAEWKGQVYAIRPVGGSVIYHGRYGYEPYQFLYADGDSGISELLFHVIWWAGFVLFALLGILLQPLWILTGGMGLSSLIAAVKKARRMQVDLPIDSDGTLLALVILILAQGFLRSWERMRGGWRIVDWGGSLKGIARATIEKLTRKRWWRSRELKFWSTAGVGRETLLEAIQKEDPRWNDDPEGFCDLSTRGKSVKRGLLSVTEYHSGERCLTRLCSVTRMSGLVASILAVVGVALLVGFWMLLLATLKSGVGAYVAVAVTIFLVTHFYGKGLSRKRLKRIKKAAESVGLTSVD